MLNIREGLELGGAIEAAVRGLAKAEHDFGVMGGVIVCALRNDAADVSLECARLAVQYRQRGVVGFDLAGGEAGNPAPLHRRAFDFAREHEVACTCHAGEGDGAGSVREALFECVGRIAWAMRRG